MGNLYFECNNGISGDMSVAALLDLGASREKLEKVLKSMNLENEFSYTIKDVKINSIKTRDFDVKLSPSPDGEGRYGVNNHHHEHAHHHHRNLSDVIAIIEKAHITENAKNLAKKIFSLFCCLSFNL